MHRRGGYQVGADAVSVHVNLGAEDEKTMLRILGAIAREAMEWGMPLLAMMYTRGPKVKNEYDVRWVKHAARVGAELGADIVKVVYTGSPETFREVVEGCFVPVVIAGGEKMGMTRIFWKWSRDQWLREGLVSPSAEMFFSTRLRQRSFRPSVTLSTMARGN